MSHVSLFPVKARLLVYRLSQLNSELSEKLLVLMALSHDPEMSLSVLSLEPSKVNHQPEDLSPLLLIALREK